MAHKGFQPLESQKQQFSELPEPPAPKKLPHDIQDSYLQSLETLLDSLSRHVHKIQEEELQVTNEFSQGLASLREKTPEKRRYQEEVLRGFYQQRISKIRQRRKTYRELVFDATSERKKLILSMQIQKDEVETLRRKLAKLNALSVDAGSHDKRETTFLDWFAGTFIVFEIILIVFYALVCKYAPTTSMELDIGTPNRIAPFYKFYIDITLMVFVGIGFLMTFLRKYQYSGVGFTFMIAAWTFQWSILCNLFWDAVAADFMNPSVRFLLNEHALIMGMYGAMTVLISFGAFVGMVTPVQLLLIAFFEIIFYSINIYIGFYQLYNVDIGGSVWIHTFGAYFGLGVAWVVGNKVMSQSRGQEDQTDSYTSDMFAVIGTLFYWILFPSFNAAFAPDDTQYRVVVNTVLALTTSCVFGFMGSRVFRGGKFDMIDIQNATLAGGVALGSSVSILVSPGGAMIIGAVAATISTVGYVYAAPFLQRKFGIYDVRGVHNAHGMPGVLGAVAAIISIAIEFDQGDLSYGQSLSELFPRGTQQAGLQLAWLLITIGIAVVTGVLTGFVVSIYPKAMRRFFSDDRDWHVPADFEIAADEFKYESTNGNGNGSQGGVASASNSSQPGIKPAAAPARSP